MKKILIVALGDAANGLGHVTRSGALKNTLMQRGVHTNALLVPAEGLLESLNFPPSGPQLIVLDVPRLADSFIVRAQRAGHTVIALDYIGEAVPDYSITIYCHSPPKYKTKSFVGLDYVMIRDEILNARPIEGGVGVLVVIGGGDLLQQSHDAAILLVSMGFRTTLILGPNTAGEARPNRGGNYNILRSPLNMPDLLSSCDWAVTNGGGCMFEAMALGKPTWVLPQTDKENAVAQMCFSAGGVLGVNFSNLPEAPKRDFSTVARAARNLVDGKGLQRVADIVLGLV